MEGVIMIATSRTHTVVGAFVDYTTAQRVITRLEEIGVHRDDIDITSTPGARKDMVTRDQDPDDSGGIAGFFRRIFGTDDDRYSSDYSEAVRRGQVIVSVTTDEHNQDRVADVMNDFGATDIDRSVESWRAEGYNPSYNAQEFRDTEYLEQGKELGTRPGTSPTPMPSSPVQQDYKPRTDTKGSGGTVDTARGSLQDARNIPVVQEELRVGKRAVKRGGVRIYTRVHEQPVEENVRLREERVRVDRRPADRPATEADLREHDEVVEVAEMAEEAVIDKRTRVVEEIVVGKDVTERTETIRDSVRRSDVNVEKLSGEDARFTGFDDDFRNDFRARYGTNPSLKYEDYSPAYHYGYQMASDNRYRGRRWNDVESDLRRDYESRYPRSTWEKMKDSVRYGWEKVTGQR
jgi:uncharacterized protein (TIGR02271 family)